LQILIVTPEGQRVLWKYWCRWDDIFTVVIREIVCEGMNWIHPALAFIVLGYKMTPIPPPVTDFSFQEDACVASVVFMCNKLTPFFRWLERENVCMNMVSWTLTFASACSYECILITGAYQQVSVVLLELPEKRRELWMAWWSSTQILWNFAVRIFKWNMLCLE